MELIDARNKINAKMFREFFAKPAESDEVTFGIQDNVSNMTNVQDAINDIFKSSVPDDKNVIFKVKYADTELIFTGKDFNWFLKDDRLETLKKNVYKQSKQSTTSDAKQIVTQTDDTIYNVGVAYMPDGSDDVKIDEFSGHKSDCVEWFNQQIVKHANSNGDVEILFCLDMANEERDWRTLQDLFNDGKIDVK